VKYFEKTAISASAVEKAIESRYNMISKLPKGSNLRTGAEISTMDQLKRVADKAKSIKKSVLDGGQSMANKYLKINGDAVLAGRQSGFKAHGTIKNLVNKVDRIDNYDAIVSNIKNRVPVRTHWTYNDMEARKIRTMKELYPSL